MGGMLLSQVGWLEDHPFPTSACRQCPHPSRSHPSCRCQPCAKDRFCCVTGRCAEVRLSHVCGLQARAAASPPCWSFFGRSQSACFTGQKSLALGHDACHSNPCSCAKADLALPCTACLTCILFGKLQPQSLIPCLMQVSMYPAALHTTMAGMQSLPLLPACGAETSLAVKLSTTISHRCCCLTLCTSTKCSTVGCISCLCMHRLPRWYPVSSLIALACKLSLCWVRPQAVLPCRAHSRRTQMATLLDSSHKQPLPPAEAFPGVRAPLLSFGAPR